MADDAIDASATARTRCFLGLRPTMPLLPGLFVLLAACASAQAQDAYDGYDFGRVSAGTRWVDNAGVNQSNVYAGLPNYSGPSLGTVTWAGQGSHSSSAPLNNWIPTPVSVSFRSDAAGDPAGNSHSGGAFTLPAPAVFPSVVQAQYHLYSELDENPGSYGASSNSLVVGTFYTDSSASPRSPLYYRIDWRMETTGDAILRGSAMIQNGDNLFDFSAGQGSIVGVLDSSYYAFPGTSLATRFDLATSATDMAGTPAEGRVDLWVELSLSRTPLAPIPEPASAALLALGLGALAWRSRRSTRTRAEVAR
jgi:hypothetical protein